MGIPHYLFLPNNQFVIVVADAHASEVTLIHPFDSNQRAILTGVFSQSLLSQLSDKRAEVLPVVKKQLEIIEKQYEWLTGLSQSNLKPQSLQQMVIGDELGLLFIEVTDQCNERCVHCYASSSPECHDFLNLEEVKSLLLQARQLGRPFVQFTGGDPLIHRHLVEAVAYAHELDFQGIEIYTNGLLLNDDLIEALLPYQPMLAFSLYSPDATVHDGITQVSGSHKRTIAAMHRAQDVALKVRIGMAVMEQNTGQESLMLDFAKREFFLDETAVRFDPVHETGRGINLNTKNITLKPSQNSHMPSESTHHYVVQTDKTPSDSVGMHTGNTPQRRGKLAVCANGNVSPCIFNREHQLGNIREASLMEILSNKNAYKKQKWNGNLSPSVERWNQCQYNLSCADCQMVAYSLGSTST